MAKQERRVFDKGSKVWVQRYRNLHNLAHWHFENELAVCREGTAQIMLDGRLYPLRAGECAYFCSESVHSISGAEGRRITVAQFGELFSQACYLKEPIFPDRYHAGDTLDAMAAESQDKQPFYTEKMNAMMTLLLAGIFRDRQPSTELPSVHPALMRYKQLLVVLDHAEEEVGFSQAAEVMHMAPAYFSRYFKKMSGLTFSQYLNVLRVEKAIELLTGQEQLTMTDVMSRCGFNTLRNFNRVFKEITGFAPTRLPADYALYRRSLGAAASGFDPTLASSIPLTE